MQSGMARTITLRYSPRKVAHESAASRLENRVALRVILSKVL